MSATQSSSDGDSGSVARVLLDSTLPQLDHLFDYAVPDPLKGNLLPGQRVKVPFRSHQRGRFGTVIELVTRSEFAGELASISERISPVQVLSPEIWRLARTLADRSAGSVSDILRLAIPPRQVRVEKQFLMAEQNRQEQSQPKSESEPASEGDRTVHFGDAAVNHAGELIAGRHIAVTADHGLARLRTGAWTGSWAPHLAETALAVLGAGKSVLIVVPDYRDLDQVRDSIESLGFHDTIQVHSRQPNSERYAGFLRSLKREPQLILGNRSAIYAPAADLGAILMWDDGDPLLAEPLTPYVHARDAALVRAQQQGAGILFCAHSRSAEVQRLVDMGYVHRDQPQQKRTRIIHSGSLTSAEATPGRIPEIALKTLRDGLTRGPVLAQVAAPGYSPIAVCRRCEDLARCSDCAGPIKFDRLQQGACRWCGKLSTHWACETCGNTTFTLLGAGSRRTAEQFQHMFPETRVITSDGENPRNFVDARPTLTVATRGSEPIAAGGYQAVVLLDVDRLLGLETLRAAEDCLRWWENAAALAAPGATCVVAGGGGPVVDSFVRGRTELWLQKELSDRTALRYPPAVRVASVTGGPAEVAEAITGLDQHSGVDVLGPTEHGEGVVRAIVRFPYAVGAEVATHLRAALIADAVGGARSKRSKGESPRPRRRSQKALRLRFDDRGVFDQIGERLA